ncbi:hypothetical protein [Streptococcus sp. DD13]|uniref:hypothetical protein n=1 Tax=Streptococcus sp. DD13 TaxID=1777881 RepID=UPI0007967B11|nr:hypothetical protein [Streptococcus sp. DD13]KXT78619.1 ABC transporter, ATP-binding protein [Streptococcus sp. DD13]
MFGKLLKYEFKFVGKLYFAIYATILALSVVIGLMSSRLILEVLGSATASSLPVLSFLTGVLIILLFVGIIITYTMIASRFKQSIFGRQGYLTLTLPVSTHQLILVKVLSGIFWILTSLVVTVLSLYIITTLSVSSIGLSSITPSFFNFFNIDLLSWIYNGALYFMFILQIYFSISLGHLANNHRTFLATLYFIIILVATIWIRNSARLGYLVSPFNNSTYQSTFWLAVLFNLFLAGIFYMGTYAIIRNSVNLD